MENLTRKQAEFFRVLKEFIGNGGPGPTIVELQQRLQQRGFKVASKRSVTQYLDSLAAKGLIMRTGEARGIRLVEAKGDVLVSVPVLGMANAGMATVFADEYQAGFLRISKRLLKKSSNIFALEVQGNSLNRSNINGSNVEDGDWVIIDKDYQQPQNGDYVLSIIDGMANLKKFYFDKTNGQIILSSESSEPHPPIFIHPDDAYRVNGKIIQVIKRPKG